MVAAMLRSRFSPWLLLLAACPGADPPPEPSEVGEADRCILEADAGTASEQRAAELGLGGPADFEPIVSGDSVELVFGPQGGYMVVPTIRLAAESSDGEQPCFMVAVNNELVPESIDLAPGLRAQIRFSRSGDALYCGQLYDLLGFDREVLVGTTLTVSLTVTGEDFEATDEVTMLLR